MNIFDFTQYNRLLIHILFIGLTRKKWQKKTHTHKEQEKNRKNEKTCVMTKEEKKPRRDGQIKKRVLYQ